MCQHDFSPKYPEQRALNLLASGGQLYLASLEVQLGEPGIKGKDLAPEIGDLKNIGEMGPHIPSIFLLYS